MEEDFKVSLINLVYRFANRFGIEENDYSTISFDNRDNLIQKLNVVNPESAEVLNNFYISLIEDFSIKKNRNNIDVNQILEWVIECDRTNTNLRNATNVLLNFVHTNNIILEGIFH